MMEAAGLIFNETELNYFLEKIADQGFRDRITAQT